MSIKAENNPHAKLTTEQVELIRQAIKQGIPGTALAKEYNVSTSAISRIKRNITWR